ncbi:uncharacterized protein LOC131013315 [Salvia miltiorrhiza]|uniref:uncharacterized protein LOC131013315 n=1 Tax=Salvia miltiorrhiza TaxID=226208 RepID=UPI0025AD2463|nr:uncharacterized protein LOC131013315 [Salvia miltiorrhiza]
MSTTTQGSNRVLQCGRTNKTDKSRRSWLMRDEAILLASLKELVANGWKSNNGFQAGYLTKLEEAMRKEFPTTDLKVMPHINSKITIWKKNYNSLTKMLKPSGVGFNLTGTHMIDCNDEQWEQIVKKDNNARLMRNKSWPYLDDWKEIFGKDRATGDVAEDVMEVAHEMYRNIDLAQPNVDGDYHVSLEDLSETADAADSVSETQQTNGEVRRVKKKRKSDDGFDRLIDAMVEITRTTDKRFEAITSRTGS